MSVIDQYTSLKELQANLRHDNDFYHRTRDALLPLSKEYWWWSIGGPLLLFVLVILLLVIFYLVDSLMDTLSESSPGPLFFASIAGSLFFIIVEVSLFFYIWRRLTVVRSKYHEMFTGLLQKRVFELFEIYKTDDGIRVQKYFTESRLVTEKYTVFDTKESFIAKQQNEEIIFAEVLIQCERGSEDGKDVTTVYDGVYVSFPLRRTLLAQTYISSEGDVYGFGGRTFWNTLTNTKNSPATTLFEWNEFENKLHVATSDPVEAREILTPDFMLNLLHWWNESRGNIRVSFIGNRMSLIFPKRKLGFRGWLLILAPWYVNRQLLHIVVPFWYIFRLVKDTRL